MVSLQTPVCNFGWRAPDFDLPGVDGQRHSLQSCMGENGLLVMFICNHCPYVQAIRPRLVRDCRELRDEHGIHSVAIMSNDPADYAEDGFDNMVKVAAEFDFPFSYLFDATQAVARAYDAVCTPDFFGFNRAGEPASVGLDRRPCATQWPRRPRRRLRRRDSLRFDGATWSDRAGHRPRLQGAQGSAVARA